MTTNQKLALIKLEHDAKNFASDSISWSIELSHQIKSFTEYFKQLEDDNTKSLKEVKDICKIEARSFRYSLKRLDDTLSTFEDNL